MFRNFLGRVEILVEQCRRNIREGLGRVGEALAGRPIRGEFARRPQGHAGQVADGAVVLGVAQPAERDVSRVAGPGVRQDVGDRSRFALESFYFEGLRATGYLPSFLDAFIIAGLVRRGEPYL